MPNDDIIELYVEPGHVFGQELNLRITPAYRSELEELLDEQEIPYDEGHEFSADPQLVLLGVQVLGSGTLLAALAAVINALARRNRDKQVQISRDGTQVTGFSTKDTLRVIEAARNLQEETNQQWAKESGGTPPELAGVPDDSEIAE